MAEYNDGSIVIDTELDTSDIESSIEDTRKKLTGLSGQFKEFGRTVGTAFGDFRPVFNAISSDAKALSGDLAQVERAAQNGLSNAGAVLNFHSALDKAEREAQELTLKLDELGRKQLPTHTYTMYAEELKKAQEELSRLIARQDMMSDLGVKESSAQWKRVALQVEQTQGVIIDLENDMQALRESGDAFTLGVDTDEYKALSAQLEAVRSATERDYRLIDSEKIEQAQLNVLTAQEAVIAAKTTDERTRALEKLREAQAALNDIAAESVTAPTRGTSAPENDAPSKWEGLKSALDKVGAAGKTVFSVLKNAGSTVASAFHKASEGVRTVTSGIGKLATKIASLTFKKIVSGLKSFGKEGKNAVLTANGLTKSLTSLKTMLVGRLKRTFIDTIVKGIKEGINALTQYSSAFDGVMSNIKNRSTELGANLSVSVASFISAVEPFITTILESLSKAATYLNAFIGMLQGKSTITVAKKQTDSYAASLDNAADSAKELKAQVYSFDDLNKTDKKTGADLFEDKSIEDIVPTELLEALEKIKDAILNGDWRFAGQLIGEGLNSIVQTIDDFINNTLRPKGVEWAGNIAELLNGIVDTLDFGNIGKTIADGINAVADILNTFLTTFDFVALGKGIGEGINGLFRNIEWDLLGETFANQWNALIDFIFGLVTTVDWGLVGDSLAEFVQSFSDSIDFTTAAEAISAGVNGIVDMLQHFLDGVSWEDNARKLADGINQTFAGIDWNAVGKVIADTLNALVSYIYGLIDGIDWGKIGDYLAKIVNGFANSFDLSAVSKTIGAAINGIVDTLQHFADGVKWDDIAHSIAKGLNDLIESIDWAAAGKAVSDAFLKVLGAINTAIEETDWQKLGRDVADFIKAIDWNGVFDAISEGIGAALGGFAGFLWGLIEDAWKEVVDWWYDTAYDDGEFTMQGLLDGIWQKIKDIGSWIKEHIFDPFINGFKKAFGIASPSKEMETLGGFIIEGLKNGITNAWHKITDFFTEKLPQLGTTIKTKWESMKKDTSDKWGEIKEKITTSISSAKTTAEEKISSLKTSFTQKWSGFVSDASTKWGSVKKTITDSVESIRSTATQKIETLKKDVKTKWDNLKGDLDRTDFNSTGENLVSGLQSGIERSWNSLTRTVRNLANDLTGLVQRTFEINSPSRVWAEIGEYLDKGLQQGILAEEDTVLHTVSNLARSVNRDMTINDPSIGINGATLSSVDKLTARFDGLLDKLAAVSEMLHDIGGFTTPAVAAGSYVPYAVHANAFSPSRSVTDASDALQTALDSQDDMLIEIMQLLTQILTVIRTKNLSLDAGVLSETVTRLQKKHDIDYGGF